MKVQTHHAYCLIGAGLSIPIFSSLWIAFIHLGSFAAWRPWLLLTGYWRLDTGAWNLSFNIGVVGAIMLGSLLLYVFEGAIFGVSASTLHGDARWAKRKEIEDASVLQRWGVVLGRVGSGDRDIMRTNAADYSNIFLSAPPRSGKGVGIIIPTLLDYPGSFIVYDVKGENYENTARRRLMKGDRVRIWSPFTLKLEGGHVIENRSHGFNPLAVVAANPDLEDRVTEIDILASSLLTASNPKEEGLLSSGREIFKAVCAIVCTEDNPSFGRVLDLLTPEGPCEEGGVADMQSHFAELAARAPDPLSRKTLIAASANKNENNALYMSVLMEAGLKAWRIPAIRRATETHDFDFDRLRSFPYSIYLCVPTPYKDMVAPVVRLFFQLAMRTLLKRLPDKETEPFPVLFMIDEFHSLGYMREMKDAPTLIPGFGGRIVTVVQTPASLDEIYGRDAARILLDVAQLKIFMTPNDNGTKEMIERTLGYQTVVSRSVSGKHFGSGTDKSHSYSEIKRPLMSADEIGRMPGDREIIAIQGRHPVYAERIRFFEDPYFRALHDSQKGKPWPTEQVPVVKSGPVTTADQFLAPMTPAPIPAAAPEPEVQHTAQPAYSPSPAATEAPTASDAAAPDQGDEEDLPPGLGGDDPALDTSLDKVEAETAQEYADADEESSGDDDDETSPFDVAEDDQEQDEERFRAQLALFESNPKNLFKEGSTLKRASVLANRDNSGSTVHRIVDRLSPAEIAKRLSEGDGDLEQEPRGAALPALLVSAASYLIKADRSANGDDGASSVARIMERLGSREVLRRLAAVPDSEFSKRAKRIRLSESALYD